MLENSRHLETFHAFTLSKRVMNNRDRILLLRFSDVRFDTLINVSKENRYLYPGRH
jgi:hypothetical protein